MMGRMMAAALHFRGHGLVSGKAAAQLWGLMDTTQVLRAAEPIDILLVGRSAARRAGMQVRFARTLAPKDIRWRSGIPVTSPALTVLQLAAQFDELELEAVLMAGLRKNLMRVSQIQEVMERNAHAKGVAKVRALLERPDPLQDTRSGYERKLLTLLHDAEIPRPQTNAWVGGKLVDAYWPDLKLVIEFDGWGVHGRRGQFETDRVRDQELTAAGHHVVRVTAQQIDHKPLALTARIAATIALLRLGAGAT
jgi:very-short-patch-repair endonuclease